MLGDTPLHPLPMPPHGTVCQALEPEGPELPHELPCQRSSSDMGGGRGGGGAAGAAQGALKMAARLE